MALLNRPEQAHMIGDQASSMSFGVYTRREIELMSVKKITQAKTFDELGHAIPGGLHDLALGPEGEHHICPTCQQPGTLCTGHVGHIQLAAPTFNPTFFQTTIMLLRGSCLFCQRLTCGSDSRVSRVLIAQLRCLKMGMPSAVLQINDAMEKEQERLEKNVGGHSMDPSVADAVTSIQTLFESVTGVNWDSYKEEDYKQPLTRNVVEMRDHVMKSFQRRALFYRCPKCPYCHRKAPKTKHNNQVEITLDYTNAARKKAREAVDGDDVKTEVNVLHDGNDEGGDENDDLEAALIQSYANQPLNRTIGNTNNGVVMADPAVVKDEMTASTFNEQLCKVERGELDMLVWRGLEARDHFRMLWRNDGAFLCKVYPLFSAIQHDMASMTGIHKEECPLDVLFFDVLAISPTRFRPLRIFAGEKRENGRTTVYRKVMELNEVLMACVQIVKGDKDKARLEFVNARIPGTRDFTYKMHQAYRDLQRAVNSLFDSDLDKMETNRIAGVKQILEKKEGLFRKHMMGKRVNYACRSVITPDPYLAVDEIGVPVVFAKRLTFTEYCNPLNLSKMRELVNRGPEEYPGANYVMDRYGGKKMLPEGKPEARATESKRLRLADANMLAGNPSAVLRHVVRGDILLMNRQPTLHKPSIMGHRVRVLHKQTALRMNYAPCKAYNADFDGDEMNGHFVQDHSARAEAYELASVKANYTVPKDGSPILGLIQDHVISGVLLSMRDRFFEKTDYDHLLLNSFPETTRRFTLLPPTILHPHRLWTGKQVISSVILNVLPSDMPAITLNGKAKTPSSSWVMGDRPFMEEMAESIVVIRRGELLQGVLDKAHYGATTFGLIHCVHELYGPSVSCDLLSAFSRLFTTFLQLRGFSLGVRDIIVDPEADAKRKKSLKAMRLCGDSVVRNAFKLQPSSTNEELTLCMARAYNNKAGEQGDVKQLDYNMKLSTNTYNDEINKAIMPKGLQHSFPSNSLQMMIQTGAKGTTVNAMQISCMLGQIELEGCRPPLTAAGRTLPSFREYDVTPRAGGFVEQRFLTGVKPQELFFHTMAGREGLIDTAVKTSRSGYLQRCVIKHLEGITVAYDKTVRDADKSVVQFRYGEDGMDIGKVNVLNPKHYSLLSDNYDVVVMRNDRATGVTKEYREEMNKAIDGAQKMFMEILAHPRNGCTGAREYQSGFAEYSKKAAKKMTASDVAMTEEEEKALGVNMQFKKLPANRRAAYIREKWYGIGDERRRKYNDSIGITLPPPVAQREGEQLHEVAALPERIMNDVYAYSLTKEKKKAKRITRLLYIKGAAARAEPGENVGLLAAQSIGEPSTQMTLNTFHFAGRGEMNVTLGIPRLREILMTASKVIKTPTASVPVLAHVTREQVNELVYKLDRIPLKQLLQSMHIKETLTITRSERHRRYKVTLRLLKRDEREPNARHLSRLQVMQAIESRFVAMLSKRLGNVLEETQKQRDVYCEKMRKAMSDVLASLAEPGDVITARLHDDEAAGGKARKNVEEGEISSDEEGGAADADAADARLKARHDDEANDYDGEEEETAENNTEEEMSAVDENRDAEEDEEDSDGEDNTKRQTAMSTDRVQMVLRSSDLCVGYEYDYQSNRWCSITVQLPLRKSKLDVTSILTQCISQFVVQKTDKIEKCTLREDNDGTFHIQTMGVNVRAFMAYGHLLDMSRLYSNCMHTIAEVYGIEAAAKAIKKEISSVFAVYGIEVDARHLTLTSDYMTHCGDIRAFNRMYMNTNASPLQQMSFETTTAFMKTAMLAGYDDNLTSPSAAITVGIPFKSGGTGCFDIRMPWENVINEKGKSGGWKTPMPKARVSKLAHNSLFKTALSNSAAMGTKKVLDD